MTTPGTPGMLRRVSHIYRNEPAQGRVYSVTNAGIAMTKSISHLLLFALLAASPLAASSEIPLRDAQVDVSQVDRALLRVVPTEQQTRDRRLAAAGAP